MYAILADQGFFPREDLWRLRQVGQPSAGASRHDQDPRRRRQHGLPRARALP
ncbi:MAG: hypothetical protein M0C28_30340 [Candidatus Moduliflexus flocculans]|nr:hypothetical protein [Candidatus Moduliflexus flocculans]